jgi:hypothetical protein
MKSLLLAKRERGDKGSKGRNLSIPHNFHLASTVVAIQISVVGSRCLISEVFQ